YNAPPPTNTYTLSLQRRSSDLNSASDLVSSLRTAQTNAQSNVQCLTNSSNFAQTTWIVTLNNNATNGSYTLVCTDNASYSLTARSEEHTSELQSLAYLVCRLLL